MRKPSRKVIKVYRSLAPRILPLFPHWLSSVVELKVHRFNFYSRQCNIRYSGAIALTRRRVLFIARLKSIILFLFVLFYPLYVFFMLHLFVFSLSLSHSLSFVSSRLRLLIYEIGVNYFLVFISNSNNHRLTFDKIFPLPILL